MCVAFQRPSRLCKLCGVYILYVYIYINTSVEENMCCICPYKNSCKYIKDVCKSKKIFFTLYEKVIQEV